MEIPPKEKSCTLPTTKTKKEKKICRVKVVVRGGRFGVFGSSLHEGWPGVWVVETVYVGVQNDLMRAHVVVLKDGERVCLFLEESPKPVLEHGVRDVAGAGEPQFAHCAMQFFLIVIQMFPFNN